MDKSKDAELAVQEFFMAAGIRALHIGNDSAYIFDLIVQFADIIIRGIQIKLMSNPRGTGKYSALGRTRCNQEYPPDTLIAGINVSCGLYFLAFARDLVSYPKKMRIPTFLGTTSKYTTFLHRDLAEFKEQLLVMACRSTDISTLKDTRSVGFQKEHDMKIALSMVIVVREPDNPYGDIDCYLGEAIVPSQLKYTGVKRGAVFAINSLQEHRGMGRNISAPYDEDANFKVLVVQTSDSDRDFLVIPKSVLLKDGFLTTEYYQGKQSISVPALDNHSHPYSKYWNRFDLLSQLDYQPPSDIYDLIARQCIDKGHISWVDRSNLSSLSLIVDEIKVKITNGSSVDRFSILKARSAYESTSYCIGDLPPFFSIRE